MNNGRGPELQTTGWEWSVTNLVPGVYFESKIWQGEPLATRAALSEGYLRAWLAVVTQFTPHEFYTGGWALPTEIPATAGPGSGRFIDAMWYAIPQYRFFGVNQTVINQLADWSKAMWPLGNWDLTKTAPCSYRNSVPVCSTQY